MANFYLGAPEPAWLGRSPVSLFVSHRRFGRQKTWPRALAPWALDSGGFTELGAYGEWRTTARAYATAVMRYDAEVGNLSWAAPQDWMCEPHMVARTGLSVAEHQRRTVANFLELRELWTADSECPFMPVLQGWTLDDYRHCADLYAAAGVSLFDHPVVGVGSVCRRQSASDIADLMARLYGHLSPTAGHPFDAYENNLHGFGVKAGGLAVYGPQLGSADSMAWSLRARNDDPLPGCTHGRCVSCLPYALRWRERLFARLGW